MIPKLHTLKNTVTTSWTYNHKHLVITLSIATALVWQSEVIQPYLPAVSFASVTYAENTTGAQTWPDDCGYECLTRIWVEMRTAEIVVEKTDENYKRARLEALLEANDLITKI